GSELLPGRELGETAVGEEERVQIGRSLARFLRRLHDAEVGSDLPPDVNSRADMTVRVPKTREQLAELEATGSWRRPATVDRVLGAAERLPPSDLFAVVHGDLHFRQVLLGRDATVTGGVHWGDVCRNDTAS